MQTDLRSHGLWEHTAPAAPFTETLHSSLDTNIAIIGAGVTGLSAALHLARGGYAPVLLEAAQIGFGNSGRTPGLISAGLHVRPDTLPTVLGPIYGQRLLTLLGDAPDEVFRLIAAHNIACDPVRSGSLLCAADSHAAASLANRTRQWRKWGAPVELLGRAETTTLSGSRAYAGAMLDRRAGTVQPLAYTRGLADAAIAAGARLFTNSAVTGFMRSGNRYVIDTKYGQVTAGRVIVATHSSSHGPFAPIATSLIRVPCFYLATRPLPARLRDIILPQRQAMGDTRRLPTTLRIDAAGRLVFGGIGTLSVFGMEAGRTWAMREISRVFPCLAGFDFETEWHGSLSLTQDGLPHLHRLGPEVVAMAGHGGLGIASATVFGRILADMVAGHLPDDDLPLPVQNLPKPAPFRSVRGLAYSAGSCLLHLAGARGIGG